MGGLAFEFHGDRGNDHVSDHVSDREDVRVSDQGHENGHLDDGRHVDRPHQA